MSNDAAKVSKGTSLGGCTVQEQLSERAGATRYRAVYDEGERKGQSCCITVYDASCFPSALVRERSLRELRQLMTLEAPTLLPVREVGKLDDGGIFEINDLHEGSSLSSYDKPLSSDEAFSVLKSVGQALLAAQNAGVIHRNLGPDVIFYTGDSPSAELCVGGFGVAEPQGEGSFGPLSTLAPEQVAGKVVDQRSMVYNLAALGHRLITGKDLYSGTAQEQLKKHLEGLIPSNVHERFQRALQKDARRRPMMLKQFLDELTSKAPAPAAEAAGGDQKPSTRGWTQFMEDDQVAGGSASGGSKAPANPVSEPGAEVKPSTRGWTMFMESEDAEPEPEPAKAPAAAAPAASGDTQPKTRGWTMFMDGPEGSQGDESEPEPKKEVAKAAPAAGDKPKTRGWTMFMEEDPVTAATKTSSEPAQPGAPSTVPDAVEPGAVAASTSNAPGNAADGGAATGGAPSTRGWTMFMDAPPGSGDGSGEGSGDKAQGAESKQSPEPAVATGASAAVAKSLQTQEKGPAQERPAANGDGVHTPASQSASESASESSSRFTAPKPPKKSAVEASNRRVAVSMPKPGDSQSAKSDADAPTALDDKPVKRARTMVMGASKSTSEGATPSAAPGSSVAEVSNPVEKAAQEPAAASASLSNRNPIPESPAPVEKAEPSIARVAAGAGVAGIVLALIVLLLASIFG